MTDSAPDARRVSPLDAAWIYVDSPETPMHVGCLQIFSKLRGAPPHFEIELERHLRSCDRLTPPFSLKLAQGWSRSMLPAWIEERAPDMEYHVERVAMTAPGGQRELGELVAELQSDPLDMTRPLWRCYLIEGLADGRYALFTKIHHSLMDGIGGMQLLQSALSADRRERNMLPPWSRTDATLTHPHEHAGLGHALESALAQLRSSRGVLSAFGALAGAAIPGAYSRLAAPYTAPVTLLNGLTSTQRRFATLQLPLETMHDLAHVAGVTLNDVFLEICASALRRYLKEIDALPAQPLIAGIPVSVRPKGDHTVGTAISFILSTLATDLDDPRQRLLCIHQATLAAKEHLQRMDRAALTEYTLLLMAPYIVELMAGRGGRGHPVFNLAISNVPGPDHPLYYNGARMEAMYPMSVLTHGQSLNITTVSYAGQLNIGFTACKIAVPHAQRLAGYARDAFVELEGLLRPKRVARRRGTAPMLSVPPPSARSLPS